MIARKPEEASTINQPSPARRFTEHFTLRPELVTGLNADHPAVQQARTIFPSTVVSALASPRLLVSGSNQRKIGDRVTKGDWAGMPIFCLTLEERATCPASCHHWRSCYGNGMPWARRHAHGAEFEFFLNAELAEKQQKHPGGFVLRLHILGDFYDSAYVALWARWLEIYPALRVFGFTARDEMSDEGLLVRMLNRDHPHRWVIRFSVPALRNVPGVRYATVTYQIPDKPTVEGSVVCPAQTNKTDCCGTCAFCWSGTKPVAFIAHGQLGRVPGSGADSAEQEDDLTVTAKSLPLRSAPEPNSPKAATVAPIPDPPTPQTPPPAASPSVKRQPASTTACGRPAGGTGSAASGGVLDPEQPVPLRAIEIRAWLRGIGANPGNYPNDNSLLLAANMHRDKLSLPRFRLIANRSSRTTESIFGIPL